MPKSSEQTVRRQDVHLCVLTDLVASTRTSFLPRLRGRSLPTRDPSAADPVAPGRHRHMPQLPPPPGAPPGRLACNRGDRILWFRWHPVLTPISGARGVVSPPYELTPPLCQLNGPRGTNDGGVARTLGDSPPLEPLPAAAAAAGGRGRSDRPDLRIDALRRRKTP